MELQASLTLLFLRAVVVQLISGFYNPTAAYTCKTICFLFTPASARPAYVNGRVKCVFRRVSIKRFVDVASEKLVHLLACPWEVEGNRRTPRSGLFCIFTSFWFLSFVAKSHHRFLWSFSHYLIPCSWVSSRGSNPRSGVHSLIIDYPRYDICYILTTSKYGEPSARECVGWRISLRTK